MVGAVGGPAVGWSTTRDSLFELEGVGLEVPELEEFPFSLKFWGVLTTGLPPPMNEGGAGAVKGAGVCG